MSTFTVQAYAAKKQGEKLEKVTIERRVVGENGM